VAAFGEKRAGCKERTTGRIEVKYATSFWGDADGTFLRKPFGTGGF
jgi:hypothetical protein